MVSMYGKEALRDMCMDYVIRPDPSDSPPCPACTRSLNSPVLLQRNDKHVVMCPSYGWELLE
jgi:hypothetical protein